jgi:hypothetical protein
VQPDRLAVPRDKLTRRQLLHAGPARVDQPGIDLNTMLDDEQKRPSRILHGELKPIRKLPR